MWSYLDKAFKTLINKRATSINKKPYEEFGDFTIDIHAQEVKAQTIPLNDPATGVSNGVVQLYTLLALTEDITVAANQSWYAFQTVRLKNWISDKYGANYAIKLYDNSNNQIFPTDAIDWIFDYSTGILTLSGIATVYPQPFKITGYRYIGAYMDTFSGGGQLKKQIIAITTNGQNSFDLSTGLPTAFTQIFEVKINGIPLRSNEWSVLGSTLSFIDVAAQFSLVTSDELEVHYY